MTGERFTLANRNHLSLFLRLLVFSGGLCPECGKGTRRTSKNWARCVSGHRVRRRNLDDYEIVPEHFAMLRRWCPFGIRPNAVIHAEGGP